MVHDYMCDGEITLTDMVLEVAKLVHDRGWTVEGWEHDDPDAETTLLDLAELWAGQENECDPEDRMTFTTWLDSHMMDGTVEPPCDSDNQSLVSTTNNILVNSATVPYKVYTQSILTAQRLMYAPKGFTYQQALNYCHQHGCDTLTDVADAGGYTILDIRDQNDVPLPDSNPMSQTYLAIREVTTRQHIEFNAPSGMSLKETYDWYMEQNDLDTVITSTGDTEVVDDQIKVTGIVE